MRDAANESLVAVAVSIQNFLCGHQITTFTGITTGRQSIKG
jgi:hypothetical protein